MANRAPSWNDVANHGLGNAQSLARSKSRGEEDNKALSPSGQGDHANSHQAQDDEINALQAIFMDDFEDIPLKGAWRSTDRSFRLHLRAFSDPETSVRLLVRLTATYPRTVPPLTLGDFENVRPKTQQSLNQFVQQKPHELIGEVMIFEIGTGIQDLLEEETVAREKEEALPSLEEERAEQEAEAQRLAERQKADEVKRTEEREAEEERVLKQMVEEEMTRRKGNKRKSKAQHPSEDLRHSLRHLSEENGYMAFDRPVTLQEEGNALTFDAVSSLAKYRVGRVTEVFTAKPAILGDAQLTFVAMKRAQISEAIASENKIKREIQALEEDLEELKRCRNIHIANVLDFKILKVSSAVDGSRSWQINILTEFANKGCLGETLEMVDTLSADRVRSWSVELLEALDFLHRNGIVHQRIHPGNVLICRQAGGGGTPSVKLADASYQERLHGLTNLSRKNVRHASALSAFWTAPELSQEASLRRTAKSDVWDLGVVFLQMVFGLNVPHKYSAPGSLTDNMSLSEPLEEIIRKFFKADPKKRPSAFDLIPSEFLRSDAAVFSRPTSPTFKRATSSALSLTPQTTRARRDSGLGPVHSRYAQEWVELGRLGKGGYGEVVKARNKLENRIYAIKKITIHSPSALTEVLSEVIFLSRLNHPYVVRYFAVWPEEELTNLSGTDEETLSFSEADAVRQSLTTESGMDFGPSTGGLDFISSSGFPKIEFGEDSDDEEAVRSDDESTGDDTDTGEDQSFAGKDLALRRTGSSSRSARPIKTTLYIQMEYCERHTLRDLIRRGLFDNTDEVWRLFRQVLEGLAHIHSHGIIHRDLKPDNIFIDKTEIPRIGDFGLATTGQYYQPEKTNAGHSLDGADMTRSIGTALYVAPELRSHVSGGYNDKVDMYSLGIIFFEMCFPLRTAMERDHILRKLREKEHTLPAEFQSADKALQGSIITALISHRPSERPSSAGLLHSGKLPVQIEDETIKQALQGLSDPSSPYYQKMMTALFSQSLNKQVKDVSWDLGASNGAHDAKAFDVVLQGSVKDRLMAIFRRHGGVEVARQNLFPRSSFYENKNVVQLLDSSGTLVQLPYDLTLPHARIIARKEPAVEKSFAFDSVYRDAYTGGAPRSNGEVDFDIVSSNTLDLALKEAEVIKVLDEIIDDFPSLAASQMCFHLNHSDLLELIMSFCRISAPQRPAVKDVLSKLNIQQWTWQKIRNELRAPTLGVSSTSLDDLARFDFRDSPEKAISRLDKIFGDDYRDQAQGVFAHLRTVVDYLKAYGVGRKIFLCPLSSFNERFYAGGVLFQCLFDAKRRDVLAAGGRYDRLIEEFRPKIQGQFTGCHAVGMNLGWDRVVASMSRYYRNSGKSAYLKKSAEEHSISQWTPRRCDILVASFDSSVLRSTGVRLCAYLWAHDISAELAVDARSPEQLMSHYREEKYSWIIIVRHEASATSKPELRVRSLQRKEDTDIRTADLLSYLRSEIRERDGREHAGMPSRAHLFRSPSSNSFHTSENTITSEKSNVQVVIAQHRSKKSNKWAIVETAQTRTKQFLDSYQKAPIVAIETKDEVLESMRDTRLSDPDTWRRVIQSVPVSDRNYLGEVHDILLKHRGRWKDDGSPLDKRIVFVINFRGGAVVMIDLGA